MDTTTITQSTPAAAIRAIVEDTDIKPRSTDKQIWGIYIALVIISIIELYSASSHEVTAANVIMPLVRHVGFLIFGLGIMLLVQRIHYKHFYSFSFVFALVSVVLMVLTLLFGNYINGARRSITLVVTLQPAEMVKLSAALMVAAILCKEQMKNVNDVTRRGVVLASMAVIVGGGLLLSQGLTNTLLLFAISLSMMIVGGVGWRKLLIVFGVFLLAGGIYVGAKFLVSKLSEKEKIEPVAIIVPGTNIEVAPHEYSANNGRWDTWVKRTTRFLTPNKFDEPINDENQQEIYSYMAQAHGGLVGVGPGNSRETARLPLAFSDYIFAIIIEEMGLIGGLVVMVLYLWLLARAGRIASRCQTAFPALLVIGMAVFIVFQALFHMAIVTGVVPVSGQPLPLISKGGTSILITSLALGIMLSVSRFAARKGESKEIKDELKELPDDVKAANPT